LSQALRGKGEHELSTYDSNFNVARVKSFNDCIAGADANLDVEKSSQNALTYGDFVFIFSRRDGLFAGNQ
jgi:hypothetical protein